MAYECGSLKKPNNDYTVCINWETQTVAFCIRRSRIFLIIYKHLIIVSFIVQGAYELACSHLGQHLFHNIRDLAAVGLGFFPRGGSTIKPVQKNFHYKYHSGI